MSWINYNKKLNIPDENIYSAWIGHELFVYDLVRNVKPKTIVELGTHNGYSFLL